ncbi:MAG: ferredoxin--NADP(+) reductase [Ectothiorhodospiraceae bacterium]|jgi:ferredoxin--NADP+ reductase|nr:ferredoxin--NADP(+) reductase [Ectothiorhodospiraceae bacterium]
MTDWLRGEVVELKRWTGNLYSLRVDAQVQPFRAGQFNRLALDVDGERIGRPYSYVNPPDSSPLDFYFITVPDGPLTRRLIDLRPGDGVWLMPRAQGYFTLDEVRDADTLWLLSTGTAIGPFLSILRTDEPWRRFGNVVLVHAVRTAPELAYGEVVDEIARAHPQRFRFIPFVSREYTDFALPGRIPQAITSGALELAAGLPLDAETSQVMICGNPDMVRDTSNVLIERGMKKNRRREPGHITTENYW